MSRYFPLATIPWPDGPRQRDQYLDPSPSTSIISAATFAAARIVGDSATAPPVNARPATVASTDDRIFMALLCLKVPGRVNPLVTKRVLVNPDVSL